MSVTFNVMDTVPVKSPYGEYLPIMDEAPEANFSNDNTINLFRAIGEKPSFDGMWSYNDIVDVQRRVLMALHSAENRTRMVIEPYRSGNVTQVAHTDEQAVYRLNRLMQILMFARRHKKNVSWS